MTTTTKSTSSRARRTPKVIRADSPTASASLPVRETKSARLMRVQIIKREHPHFEEYGRFTGEIVTMIWGAKMAKVKLEHCRHGTDACFVSPGDVAEVRER